MSLFCTLFKSKSGSYVDKIDSRQFLAFFCPSIRHLSRKELAKKDTSPHSKLSEWFITALVRAGKCEEHAWRNGQNSSQLSSPRLGQRASQFTFFSRTLHTESPSRSANTAAERDHRSLLNIVDNYHHPYEGPEPDEHLINLRKPDIIISDKKEDEEWPHEKYRFHGDWKTEETVAKLRKALAACRSGNTHEDLFELYEALPHPRAPFLPHDIRHELLYYLATAEERDERMILRYLFVVDDLKTAAVPLLVQEWNMAIHLATKLVYRVTDVELEAGLRTWREMERVAGVPGNHVTFNILFDVAIKAGKFALAERIYEEMITRGHVFNRFHHVSKIFYYGLRRDGDRARRAYKDLVESGEIVDTVVLNCLISALLNSKEPQAALQVYERMKRLHSKRSHKKLPPTSPDQKRGVRQALVRAAYLSKKNDKLKEKFQAESIIAPDFTTFRTLLSHYAIVAGELDKVTTLINEMNWYLVPVNGRIFLILFQGFAIHGGIRYSDWTSEKLERVWKSFLNVAQDASYQKVYLGKWMVVWALNAFRKCVGLKRVLEIWEELRSGDELEKWLADGEMETLVSIVELLVRGEKLDGGEGLHVVDENGDLKGIKYME